MDNQNDRERGAREARPRRYKLYDKIAGRVSVGAMNVVIIATALLLIAAIVVGVMTRTPQ